MKKTLLFLLCLAVLLGAIMLEGGSLPTVLAASALLPILLGPVARAYFSFKYR